MKKYFVLIMLLLSVCLITGCKKKMVSVTLDLKGGMLETEEVVFQVEKKSTFDFPTPVKPGYRFKGWKTVHGDIYDNSTKITEDVSLYAIWEDAVYTITYDLKEDEKILSFEEYTIETIINDFIKDYNLYSKIVVDKENFFATATAPLFENNGMFTNKAMLEKWNWFIVYINNVCPSYVGIELEKGLSGNLTNINEKYIMQELDGFVNQKTSTAYSKTKPSAKYNEESVINEYKDILNEVYIENKTTYEYGDSFKLNKPIKEGNYRFIGWSYNGQIIEEVTEETYGDLVLTPVWDDVYYQINYNLDGGKFESYFELYKESNQKITLPIPKKTGKEFMGWFDEEGNRYYALEAGTTGEINLKAKWGAGYCYIYYYDYNNELIEKVEIEVGQTAPVKSAGELDGNTLEWYENDHIYDFSTIVKDDLYLFAKWDFIETIIKEMFPEDLSQGLNVIENYTYNNQNVEIFWSSSSFFIDVYGGAVRLPSTKAEVTIDGEFTMNNKSMSHSFKLQLDPITFPSLKGKPATFGYFVNSLIGFDATTVVDTLDVLIHGFARVTSTFGLDLSEVKGSMKSVLEARKYGTRVLLCTGAYGAAAKVYSDAASTESGRKTLARNLVQAVIEYGYDGIDIDWEYPGYETGRKTEVDRANYTLLVEEIYNQLKAVNKDYLLTAAIPGGSSGYVRYDLRSLNKYFDYIQLMTYDLQSSDRVTHHTPLLYDSKTTVHGSVSTTIDTFTREGVSAEKLVVGIAFYGRVYTLTYAPDTVEEVLGYKGIKESGGHMPYTDIYRYYIKASETDSNILVLYDSAAKAPYIYVKPSKTVISYDDPQSIKDKCQYAIDKNLGGVMFWEYWEDRTGQLLQAIKEGMNR